MLLGTVVCLVGTAGHTLLDDFSSFRAMGSACSLAPLICLSPLGLKGSSSAELHGGNPIFDIPAKLDVGIGCAGLLLGGSQPSHKLFSF